MVYLYGYECPDWIEHLFKEYCKEHPATYQVASHDWTGGRPGCFLTMLYVRSKGNKDALITLRCHNSSAFETFYTEPSKEKMLANAEIGAIEELPFGDDELLDFLKHRYSNWDDDHSFGREAYEFVVWQRHNTAIDGWFAPIWFNFMDWVGEKKGKEIIDKINNWWDSKIKGLRV